MQTPISETLKTIKAQIWMPKRILTSLKQLLQSPFISLLALHTEPSIIHLKYVFKIKQENVKIQRYTASRSHVLDTITTSNL